MSNKDSIMIEIRNLREQQCGISPKTESWKKIQLRLEELYKMQGSKESAPMRKIPKEKSKVMRTRYANGVIY